MDTRTIIERYYECVNGAAWDDWLTLFSDDVVGDEQVAGHFAGIDVLRGAVDAISRGYSRFTMIPQRVVVDGDAACVVWRCVAANAAGQAIAYPDDAARQVIGANYFQVQNGKIVYMRTIHDTVPFRPFIEQGARPSRG
jgi:ketosteroid isomerase-like protein